MNMNLNLNPNKLLSGAVVLGILLEVGCGGTIEFLCERSLLVVRRPVISGRLFGRLRSLASSIMCVEVGMRAIA